MSARGLRPLSRARGRCWWSRFPGFRRRSPYMVAQGGGIVKPHPGRRFSARVALPAEIGGAGGWLISPRRSAGLPMLIAKQGSSATRSRLHRRRKTTPARAAASIAAGRSCFAARARTARPDFPQRGRAGLARLLARRCAPLWPCTVGAAALSGFEGLPRGGAQARPEGRSAPGKQRVTRGNYIFPAPTRLCAGRGRAPRRAPDVHKAPRHPLKPSIGKTAHARVPPLARPAADASSEASNSQSAHDLTGSAFLLPSGGAFLILRI